MELLDGSKFHLFFNYTNIYGLHAEIAVAARKGPFLRKIDVVAAKAPHH